MQFVDLATQQKKIRGKIDRNIRNVLDHGQYIMGPEVGKLEDKLSIFSGTKHAIACASGTDALLMALMAYEVGPGDAVFTTPFTFVATAEAICVLGATPVFVDIESDTFNIDPNKLDKAIDEFNRRQPVAVPRGIIAVDLFGLPADYESINAIAHKHGLFVIEDGAQSFGAEYHHRPACSLAHIGCTSFFPAKPLGCYGDGGMCFTEDDGLSERLKSLRVHGMGSHKYKNVRIGINGRLDSIQAAILLAKLDIFPEEIMQRNRIADTYTEQLKQSPDLTCPVGLKSTKSIWAQYSVLAKDTAHRKRLRNRLKQAGIPTAIYYPHPLHLQSAFAHLGYCKGDFPVCEACSKRIFSLPMHPYLTANDQNKILKILLM